MSSKAIGANAPSGRYPQTRMGVEQIYPRPIRSCQNLQGGPKSAGGSTKGTAVPSRLRTGCDRREFSISNAGSTVTVIDKTRSLAFLSVCWMTTESPSVRCNTFWKAIKSRMRWPSMEQPDRLSPIGGLTNSRLSTRIPYNGALMHRAGDHRFV